MQIRTNPHIGGTVRALRGLTLSAFLGATALSVGCPGGDGDGDGPDDDRIQLGMINPATGALETFGPALENAVRLAIAKVNDAGGVLGSEVELVIEDSQTDANASKAAAQRLADQGVVGLIGAASSSNSLAVAEVSVAEGIPQCSGASTSPALTDLEDDGYVFRTVPSDAFQGAVLGKRIAEDGHSTVAILHIDDAYGNALASVTQAAFEAEGGTVTTKQSFVGDAIDESYDFQSDFDTLFAGNPDAVVLIGFPGNAGLFLQNWAVLGGFSGQWYLTDGLRTDELINLVGATALEGFIGTAPLFGVGENYDSFSSAYQDMFNEAPGLFADTYYDCAALMMLSVAKAGAAERDRVRDAVGAVSSAPGSAIGPFDFADALTALDAGDDIDYTGASGAVDLDENGDVSGPVEIWKIQGGAIVQDSVVQP